MSSPRLRYIVQASDAAAEMFVVFDRETAQSLEVEYADSDAAQHHADTLNAQLGRPL